MAKDIQTEVSHGRLSCRACWKDHTGNHQLLDGGRSQLINDPGYWGAADPSVLVLGMTKGFTQSNQMNGDTKKFDGVAFAGFRPRLLQTLQAIGLMQEVKDINPKLTATETEYGFASMVRCSLTALDKGNAVSASGKVVSALKNAEAGECFETCAKTFLPALSNRTRLVVLLGNSEQYVTYVNEAFSKIFADYQSLSGSDGLVFRAGGRFYVFTGHPSGSNGHFAAFVTAGSSDTQGRKCKIVRSAVEKILADK